jgi:polyribonucleotide nucleotidyltransferase
MNKELSQAREDVSEFAPRYTTMKVDTSKIAEVIGKGRSCYQINCRTNRRSY